MTEPAQTQVVGSEPLRIPRFKDAFQRILPKLEALEEDLLIVNLDIPTIVTTVLGSMSEIRKLREQCARVLPTVDLAAFDNIETHVLAMGYAHSRHQAASRPVLPVQQLSDSVVTKRDLFAADCVALASRKLIDGERLKELKGTVGFKNQAFDLLTLVALMREGWQQIQGKAAVTLAELDEAETLADQLLTAVGEREQLPAAKGASAEMRKRAYTLCVRTYNELRRTATYLRWHDEDADAFVPSIYAGKKQKATETTTTETPAPEPAPTVTPQPTSSAKEVVAVGMPNSDPFTGKN